MATFAKTTKRLPGSFNVCRVERNDTKAQRNRQPVEIATTRLSLSGLSHHGNFEVVRRSDLSTVGG